MLNSLPWKIWLLFIFLFFLVDYPRPGWINKSEVNGFILDRVYSYLWTGWLCHFERDVFVLFRVQEIHNKRNKVNIISAEFRQWFHCFFSICTKESSKFQEEGLEARHTFRIMVIMKDFKLFWGRLFFKWFGTFTLQQKFYILK